MCFRTPPPSGQHALGRRQTLTSDSAYRLACPGHCNAGEAGRRTGLVRISAGLLHVIRRTAPRWRVSGETTGDDGKRERSTWRCSVGLALPTWTSFESAPLSCSQTAALLPASSSDRDWAKTHSWTAHPRRPRVEWEMHVPPSSRRPLRGRDQCRPRRPADALARLTSGLRGSLRSSTTTLTTPLASRRTVGCPDDFEQRGQGRADRIWSLWREGPAPLDEGAPCDRRPATTTQPVAAA